MTSRTSTFRRFALATIMTVVGCSDAAKSPNLPHFQDIASAPAVVQTAARAVVRISTAGEAATGSFISDSGLMLTNNHVLGAAVCPIEGCWIQIASMHQVGVPPQQSQILFAVPVAVDIGLDMATVQLSYAKGGPALDTPDYLSFNPLEAAALVGMHATVVGHPEGRLKKWTDGVVYDSSGDWFYGTAYALPGDSGSPVLDDDGKIIGLLHRSPTSQDLITTDNVNEYFIGTASAPLVAAMAAPLPAAVVSVAAETTAAQVVEGDLLYLNAGVVTVSIDSMATSILALLASACDAALSQQDFQSIDDFSTVLAPCNDAMTWIDCRVDASSTAYRTVCPSADEATAWADRFDIMSRRSRNLNNQLGLYPVTFGVARLSATVEAGKAVGRQLLQRVLNDAQPVLDFSLANYLAAFEVPSYGATSILAYVDNYGAVLHYEQQATSIVSTAAWLYGSRSMSKTALLSLLSQLHDDPHVGVGTKLYIEEMQYYRQ